MVRRMVERKLSSQRLESCTTSSACGLTGAGHCNGVLPILPVNVKSSKGNKVIETYAFLDPGSTETFCSEKLIDRLTLKDAKPRFISAPWVMLRQ